MSGSFAYVFQGGVRLSGKVITLPIALTVWTVENIIAPILTLPETLWIAMNAQHERAKMTAEARNSYHESAIQMKIANDQLNASFRYVLEKIHDADRDLATFNPHFSESLEAAQSAFAAHQERVAHTARRQL